MERYVRLAFLEGRSVAWPSQIRGIRALVERDSFVLCTPTGSGKTTIAELGLLQGLFRLPRDWIDEALRDIGLAPLCLYLVPSRALAAEVEAKLHRVLNRATGDQSIEVTSLYGGAIGAADLWMTGDVATVLICTPEKAEALLRVQPNLLNRLRLVILDEAHKVEHDSNDSDLVTAESRPLRVEALVSRLRSQPMGERTRFIAMSAVATAIQDPLSHWMTGSSDVPPTSSEYRSTRQLVGRLLCQRHAASRIEYDMLDGHGLQVAGRSGEAPFVPQPFPPHPGVAGMNGPLKGMAPYSLWAAMHLTSSTDTAALISVANQVDNFASWFTDILENQWGDAEMPTFFIPPDEGTSDDELWQRALEATDDYFGAESNEYKLLRRGIVVHHGRMPGRLPRLLVELIEQRIAPIVVATSTLTDGVNLPFETILVPGLARPPRGRMSGREFTNLVGRAGRPGVTTEGQTLVLIPEFATSYQRTSAMRDYRAVIAEMLNPIRTSQVASSPLERLLQIISAHVGPENLVDWLEQTAPLEIDETTQAIDALDTLDSILLPALADAEDRDLEDTLRAAWRSTFAHAATRQSSELEAMFVTRGTALATTIYPASDQRARLYRTNLPPRDARSLEAVANELLDHLRSGTHYASSSSEDQLNFVQGAVAIVRTHRRFNIPDRIRPAASAPTWEDILQWWLDPSSSALESTPSRIGAWHKFIADRFGYKFNWGLGAAISLATSDVADPNAVHTAEHWRRSDLPWIALWLKELIEWGTLDPAVAFILARGLARTRPHAAEMAVTYRNSLAHDRDPLDIDNMRAWAAGLRSARRPRHRLPLVDVQLVRDFSDVQAARPWRVVPLVREEHLEWADAAGYVLAQSDLPERWRPAWARTYDFALDPANSQVSSMRYV